jgi:nitrogen-specific signal transduction histidine kinase
MSCLAGFASGAILLKQTLAETERAAAAAQVVAAMAHDINNPLQGATLAVFCAQSRSGLKADVRELLWFAEAELQRVAALSAELITKTAAEIRVLQKERASS